MAKRHKYYFKDSNTVRIIDRMNEVLGKKQTKLMNTIGLLKRRRFFLPVVISGRYDTDTMVVNGRKCVTIHPKEKKSDLHIVYYHGGAYVSQGRIVHWILLSKLVSDLGCRATYVDYPLAPESNYEETIDMAEKSYIELTERYGDDSFILAGDSAGGGLALALAQLLRDKNVGKQPEKLVLICPWLDISMGNRRIRPIEKKDFILKKDSLIEFAKQYAGEGNLKNPLVSPLYGKLEGLGEILLTSGTHEIIYADCHELYKKAKKHHIDLTFLVYRKMTHVWIFYPIREAGHLYNKIIEFIEDRET